MQELYFPKPETSNLIQLNRELFKVDSIIADNIVIQVLDGLNLTEAQIAVVQAKISSHTSNIVVESVTVNGDELMACMDTDIEIDSVLSDIGALALLQFLGLRDQQIKLTAIGANKVMTYLLGKTLITQISADAIKAMLEAKGLIFPV
jgi:hypothetical protein